MAKAVDDFKAGEQSLSETAPAVLEIIQRVEALEAIPPSGQVDLSAIEARIAAVEVELGKITSLMTFHEVVDLTAAAVKSAIDSSVRVIAIE